jgi:two-component system, NarL family, response regulator
VKPKSLLTEVLYGRALSERELEVLHAAANGETMEETATRLWLSLETIKSHRRNVIAKLGARNLSHAIALAVRSGLMSVESVEPVTAAA